MANLTLDINTEIDKVWNYDIDEVILLMQGGPYTRHLLESLAIPDTAYKLGKDPKGRSFYVDTSTAGQISLKILIERIADGVQHWVIHSIPTEVENGLFTYLNKRNMIGRTSTMFMGVKITMKTLIRAGDGSIWRPTGHVDPTTKDVTVRSTFNVSDPGITLTALSETLPPLSEYKPGG